MATSCVYEKHKCTFLVAGLGGTKFQMSLFENAGTYQEFFKRRWEKFL
jgi:hypothetical protein